MYTPYLSYSEYKAMGGMLSEQEANKYLKQASRHIDSLTFNRIIKEGFNNLTDFQKEIIKEVVFNQVLFEYDNEDLLTSTIGTYSINGVSMNMNSLGWNIHISRGVAITSDNYELLSQTGLTVLTFNYKGGGCS